MLHACRGRVWVRRQPSNWCCCQWMVCGRCVIEGCANKPHVGGNTLAGGTEQSSGKLQLSSALCWIKADMQMEAAALVVMADKGPHLQSSSDHPRLHVPTGHSLQGAFPVLDPKPGMHLRGVREERGSQSVA